MTTRLIYYQNLSYPQWTYNNLVFPQLSYVDPIDPAQNESTISMEIPAIRPALQCIKIPPKDFSYDKLISFKSYGGPGLPEGTLSYYKTVVDLPCLVNGTVMGCDFDLSFPTYLPVETPEGSVTGTANTRDALLCDAVPRGLDRRKNATNTYPLADGCPNFAYFLGTTSTSRANDTSFKQGKPEIYGFLCYQHLEQMQTKATFKMPKLSISTSTPPFPIEETAKTLNMTDSKYTGPSYSNSLETLLDAFPGNHTLLDSFMRAVIEGKGGLDVKALLGEAGIPKLMTSTENLYATYMVQAINTNFRIPLDDNAKKDDKNKESNLQTSYPATLTKPHRQRLKQDPATKLALQIMLAFMTCVAIAVFVLTDRETRLPISPCSIAGTMVLLAGSELATKAVLEGDGAEGKGFLCSLSWGGGSLERRRFGIDVGRADGQFQILDGAEGDYHDGAGGGTRGRGEGNGGREGGGVRAE